MQTICVCRRCKNIAAAAEKIALICKSVIEGKGSLHFPTTVSCVTKGMMSHTQSYSYPTFIKVTLVQNCYYVNRLYMYKGGIVRRHFALTYLLFSQFFNVFIMRISNKMHLNYTRLYLLYLIYVSCWICLRLNSRLITTK